MSYNAVFEIAHAHVAKWEGKFFDHKDDPGGVTMYGVSLRWLKDLGAPVGDIDGDGDIDRDDVMAVTPEIAKSMFRREFWDRPRCGLLPGAVAAVFYDTAVNCGTGRAARLLQEAAGTSVDGVVGPKTRAAVLMHGELRTAFDMITARNEFYTRLAEQRPQFQSFLRGWLNRTTDLHIVITKNWG